MSEKLILSTYHILEWGDGYYFIPIEFNLLCRIDKRTKNIQFVDSIPKEPFWGNALVSKIVEFQGEFIFVPMNAKKIWIRNMESGKWRNISLKGEEDTKFKFFQAISCREKIYLIGCKYKSIVCVDMSAESACYFNEIMEELEQYCHNNEKMFFRSDYVRIGACFYMASCKANRILKYNMDIDEFQLIKIGKDECGYAGIAWDGEKFWLAPRHGGTVKIWDGKEDGRNFKLLDFHVNDDRDFARKIVVDRNKVYLLLNKSTIYTSVDGVGEIQKKDESYLIYDCTGQRVRLMGSGEFLTEENGGVKFQAKLEIEKGELTSYLEIHPPQLLPHDLFFENGFLELTSYLKMIKGKDCQILNNRLRKKPGMAIWKEMRTPSGCKIL